MRLKDDGLEVVEIIVKSGTEIGGKFPLGQL